MNSGAILKLQKLRKDSSESLLGFLNRFRMT